MKITNNTNSIQNESNSANEMGYASRLYAESLRIGKPVLLKQSGGYLIERNFPSKNGATDYDLTGPYPVYSCKNWSRLSDDIHSLEKHNISVSLVTDPFFDCDIDYLETIFTDKFVLFKKHYIVNLSEDLDSHISRNHKRNIKRAQNNVDIEIIDRPYEIIDSWIELYANLAKRHGIQGVADFSAKSFELKLSLPGMIAAVAYSNGVPVGIVLWYFGKDVAYYHLAAYSNLGYELKASFPLFYKSLQYLRDKVDFLSLGGGAGLGNDEQDGLTRFKAGWAKESRDVYFCGKILNSKRDRSICEENNQKESRFFPAYRA